MYVSTVAAPRWLLSDRVRPTDLASPESPRPTCDSATLLRLCSRLGRGLRRPLDALFALRRVGPIR